MGKEVRHGTDLINCAAIHKVEYSTNVRYFIIQELDIRSLFLESV